MLPPTPRYPNAPTGREQPLRVLLQGRRSLCQAGREVREALERWFGPGSCSQDKPHSEVAGWVTASMARLAHSASLTHSPAPLVLRENGHCLTMRLVAALELARRSLHIEETTCSAARAPHLGLTEREGQVVAMIAEGKTNEAIGTILGISLRTVEKHIEHILRKLGVENRTAAAMAWTRAERADSLPPAPPAATPQ